MQEWIDKIDWPLVGYILGTVIYAAVLAYRERGRGKLKKKLDWTDFAVDVLTGAIEKVYAKDGTAADVKQTVKKSAEKYPQILKGINDGIIHPSAQKAARMYPKKRKTPLAAKAETHDHIN